MNYMPQQLVSGQSSRQVAMLPWEEEAYVLVSDNNSSSSSSSSSLSPLLPSLLPLYAVRYGESHIIYFGGFSTLKELFLSDLFILDTGNYHCSYGDVVSYC